MGHRYLTSRERAYRRRLWAHRMATAETVACILLVLAVLAGLFLN